MREVALGGQTLPEKICRAKSTNQFGERKERLPDLCFSICRFSQVVFIPRAQPHVRSLFLSPIVFGINLIHFSMRRRTVQLESRSFVSVLRSPVTPFDRSKTKSANCFEKCNVLGNGKCELSTIQEGRNSGANFWQGNGKTLRQCYSANFWQGKVQNSSPISALLR